MGLPAVGDVVLVKFPYADFSKLKRRPALVIGTAEFENFILCQITSRPETSERAISLALEDFKAGGLTLTSYIRPDKIFTVERSIVEATVGTIAGYKMTEVKKLLQQLFD